MKARSAGREETLFLRGDVGIDGQATEEQQDAQEVEQGKAREQFLRGKAYLGREFLTWLLWRSESGEALLERDGAPLVVILTDRLVLRGIAGEVVELVVRGAMAPYSPLVREALDRGLLIHAARLRLTHGERTYEVSVDAEFMDYRSARLPALLTDQEDDQIEERLYLTEQMTLLLGALLEQFLALRTEPRWLREVVPEMKAWMQAPPATGPRKDRAA